jgi:nitrogen regulatory protein P-II 2
MKMIEAIVESVKVDDVRDALSCLGMSDVTISGVAGSDRRKGGLAIWFPSAYAMGRPEESKIEVAVEDSNVENTVTTIMRAGRIVAMGNDDAFTSTIGDAIRIRPMEESEMELRA